MRPLKLVISAFGPFAGEEMLDFTRLTKNGIYLITGETGAGKTSIFDAVSFALYGEASCRARDKYHMLRSDFAGNKAKTYVELDFASGEDLYHIKRRIKKTGQEAALTLSDGTIVSGDRNIKAKILDIVGLDRDQFAQIVMIAQNDFLRFLQSGTEERVKILRNIFNTSPLNSFQDTLKTRSKDLNKELESVHRDFDRYEVDPYKREEVFVAWETQIKADHLTLDEADKNLMALDKSRTEIAAKIAVAEELAKKFTDLKTSRAALREHERRADEIKLLSERRERGETAFRKVKPLADKAIEMSRQYETSRANLMEAKAHIERVSREGEEAKAEIAQLPPLADAQTAFERFRREREAAESQLAQLTALEVSHDSIMEKQALLADAQAEQRTVEEGLKRLPPLDEAQNALEQLERQYELTCERVTKLTALRAECSLISAKQTTLESLQAEFETLNGEFNLADNAYRTEHEAFLRSQAGILASRLTEGTPCPVCGSTEHPVPAKLSEDNVTEAKLKKVKNMADKARERRDGKVSECVALKTETETISKRLLADLEVFTSEVCWETAGSLLNKLLDQAAADLDALAHQKTADKKALSELSKLHTEMMQKRDELSPKCTELKTEIATLIQRFNEDFSGVSPKGIWDAAGELLAEALTKAKTAVETLVSQEKASEQILTKLSANWEKAKKRAIDADAAHRSALTLLEERKTREREQKKLHDEARTAYIKSLHNNGFVEEWAYTVALVTEEDLVEMTQHLADYRRIGEQLDIDIKRLECETENKEEPDLEKLGTESGRQKAAAEGWQKKRDEVKSRLEQTERKLKELRLSAEQFVELENQCAAVKRLSDTANGKLDFETYAQMAYFEHVLRAANQRLKVMSKNRYSLMRKTDSDDGRKRAGLELEVLDAYTGKTRSANSLSGGESFMASLSLALGLSDVVQQSVGGIHLEAMFIDEGFGSLDAEVLDLAVSTLSEMARENRVIGIISHVAELRERIDKQVYVEKSTAGSRISLEE